MTKFKTKQNKTKQKKAEKHQISFRKKNTPPDILTIRPWDVCACVCAWTNPSLMMSQAFLKLKKEITVLLDGMQKYSNNCCTCLKVFRQRETEKTGFFV